MSKGIGFFEALTITLMVLKLCGVIDISWIWVFYLVVGLFGINRQNLLKNNT